jgi:protein-disulfide isomerase
MKSAKYAILPVFLFLFLAVRPATAQFSGPELKPVDNYNTALLHLPRNAQVAIIVFEDLQCPDCAHANPLLREAAEQFGIPLVRRDFPLPKHAWAFAAAVDARWFDTKSPAVGDSFRNAVMANQAIIHSIEDLRTFAAQFARQNDLQLPAAVDPQGTLAAQVQADVDLGHNIGLIHTPTVWVVSSKSSGAPFVELVGRTALFERIKAAQAESAAK